MTGDRCGEHRGIIPRAIEELLQQSQDLQSGGWEIQLSMSIVELYNEEIRDLLTSSSQNNAMSNGEKFKIFRQNNGRVLVNGLTNSPIATDNYELGLQQFYDLLEKASQIRSTACTNMNETSSRSHLIVMIDVVGIYSPPNGYGQKIILNGGLRLCDLAGSERLDRTNTLNDATRLKETVNINKSLSCLADVFLALSNKQQHVPYRNSKLTMLLQVRIVNEACRFASYISSFLGLSVRGWKISHVCKYFSNDTVYTRNSLLIKIC
jgi:kinesin family protein C1